MKISKIYPIFGAAAMMAVLAGCSEEQTLPVGEGKIFLSARVNSDVVVESRAEAEDELAASTQIWISSSEGVVRKYSSMSEVPASGVTLLSGQYTIQAWAGKAAYASFDDRWFEGSESFEITAGDRKSIEVTCKIANVCASVSYDEDLAGLLTDAVMTVGHRGGTLEFEGTDDARRGYFMMPDGITSLDWTLTATADGKAFTKTGVIENVEPAHEYRLNIVSNASKEEIGGAWITIEVDDTMIESEDQVTITTPPAITGYGFDIKTPVAAESGSVGRKSVYVSASSRLTEVQISGLPGIEAFDFVRANAQVIEDLAAKGIMAQVEDFDNGAQMMKLIFEDTFLNELPNSDEPYEIRIRAKDLGNKVTSAVLTLKISEAPVITTDAPEADSYDSVTLQGQVVKDGLESVGFLYRLKGGDADWQYVAGQAVSGGGFAKGDIYQAVVSAGSYDAEVEYKAVCGTAADPTSFQADVMAVATKPTPQLPNRDMEEWSNTGTKNCIIPVANGGVAFWDCGNHGAITMGKNVTESSSEKRHSGSLSARLKSDFVGVGALGKLASGNICVGEYLKTDGTNGVFGFGRQFNFDGLRPKALRLWVHYTPVAVSHTGKGCTLKKGDMDMAHIFVALFDDTDPDTADGVAPFIVRTNPSKPKYFNRDADWIMAYGEKILTDATPGSSMVELEIPIEYKSGSDARIPQYLTIVCTASKEGDYYTGGSGSTLYVDDFQLVY
ncbi:MAG: DUF4493 domain-containing protein [Muribaculaceae bacterium]|nr:DUF4493 domain-containing protein [Muribaculaceae bacterium]